MDKESKSLSNRAREEGKTRQQVGDIMLGVSGGYLMTWCEILDMMLGQFLKKIIIHLQWFKYYSFWS